MKEIFNGAIIGCGVIANYHAAAYKKVKNVKLVSVCDSNIARANKFAKKYNVPNFTNNYKELLSDEKIDFVEILTPHSSHLKICKAAIDHGKAINLQKVPTVNIREFEQLERLIGKSGVKLRVFENFRYYEPYIFAKSLIEKNEIGKIQIVNITKYGAIKNAIKKLEHLQAKRWRIKESENFSHPTIFDDGYHKHSLIEFFLGEEVTQVKGWCRYDQLIPGIKVDSPVDVSYFTKNNKLGTFQSININIKIENNFYSCDEIVEIVGDSGIVKIYGGHGLLFTKEHNSPIRQGVYWLGKDSNWQFSNKMNLDIRSSFVLGLEKFIEMLAGREDTTFTLSDAKNSLKIGLGIVKSLRNNNRVIGI